VSAIAAGTDRLWLTQHLRSRAGVIFRAHAIYMERASWHFTRWLNDASKGDREHGAYCKASSRAARMSMRHGALMRRVMAL
jgi:hypothetical protein